MRIKEIKAEKQGWGEMVSDSRTVCRALLPSAMELELCARLGEQKSSRITWKSAAGKGGTEQSWILTGL